MQQKSQNNSNKLSSVKSSLLWIVDAMHKILKFSLNTEHECPRPFLLVNRAPENEFMRKPLGASSRAGKHFVPLGKVLVDIVPRITLLTVLKLFPIYIYICENHNR